MKMLFNVQCRFSIFKWVIVYEKNRCRVEANDELRFWCTGRVKIFGPMEGSQLFLLILSYERHSQTFSYPLDTRALRKRPRRKFFSDSFCLSYWQKLHFTIIYDSFVCRRLCSMSKRTPEKNTKMNFLLCTFVQWHTQRRQKEFASFVVFWQRNTWELCSGCFRSSTHTKNVQKSTSHKSNDLLRILACFYLV